MNRHSRYRLRSKDILFVLMLLLLLVVVCQYRYINELEQRIEDVNYIVEQITEQQSIAKQL